MYILRNVNRETEKGNIKKSYESTKNKFLMVARNRCSSKEVSELNLCYTCQQRLQKRRTFLPLSEGPKS
jgi:hypothetical protein